MYGDVKKCHGCSSNINILTKIASRNVVAGGDL